MGDMPIIHFVSVVHLCLVAAFLGLYACEVVVEVSHQRDELHPTAIRIHYLLDVFVEIPLVSGILVSGVVLALLVEKITSAHVWLIASGTVAVLACVLSFWKFARVEWVMRIWHWLAVYVVPAWGTIPTSRIRKGVAGRPTPSTRSWKRHSLKNPNGAELVLPVVRLLSGTYTTV